MQKSLQLADKSFATNLNFHIQLTTQILCVKLYFSISLNDL